MRFPALVLLVASAIAAPPSRTWTTRDGRTFEAELAAADGLRATFTATGKPPVIAPLASLSAEDAAFVRQWRGNWRNPLIAPGTLAPWPAQAVAPVGALKSSADDGGVFTWESANFRITSDLRIPDGAAEDIARVFEATRSALIAMPLGLHAGGETERYAVSMFRDGAAMASSDDVTITLKGTGGHGAMPHLAADPIVAAASIVIYVTLMNLTVIRREEQDLQDAHGDDYTNYRKAVPRWFA